MRTKQRYRSATLKRVQQFLDAHSDAVGAINQLAARHQLDVAVAETEATVTEQGARARVLRGERARQVSLEAVLKKLHLTPTAKVARARLRGVPHFAALTPSIVKLSGDQLVRAARAVASAAEPYAAQFVAAGRPSDFVDRLRRATDAVQQSLAARAEHSRSRQGATRQVQSAISDGRQAVMLLDAALSEILFANERLAAEWAAAKRVGRPSGRAARAADSEHNTTTGGAPVVTLLPTAVAATSTVQEVKVAA